MDYKVCVYRCAGDAVVARRHGSCDGVVDSFPVEVLYEGLDEFKEASGLQRVRRPSWKRCRAFFRSCWVEMPGFWSLIPSSVMMVMELDSSKARSTRCSGLIVRNARVWEREGGGLYRRVRICSTLSLAGRTSGCRIKSLVEREERRFFGF